MTEWITLDELKNDQSLDAQVLTRDDQSLQRVLTAAMAFVQRWRPDLTYTGPWTVPADIKLGTIRLAAHWSVRMSLDLGEMGSRRADKSGLDSDIYLQLGIRR
jgi:hypothetical protein